MDSKPSVTFSNPRGRLATWLSVAADSGFSGCRASHLHLHLHLHLLRELYALYTSRAVAPSYYSTRDGKTIDLAAFDSRRLWPLLDEAADIGLQLVHARNGSGRSNGTATRSCAWTSARKQIPAR